MKWVQTQLLGRRTVLLTFMILKGLEFLTPSYLPKYCKLRIQGLFCICEGTRRECGGTVGGSLLLRHIGSTFHPFFMPA